MKTRRVRKCECGMEVVLDKFTCPCECGRDYSLTGQLLAPREQWGEETGESWRDCFFDLDGTHVLMADSCECP